MGLRVVLLLLWLGNNVLAITNLRTRTKAITQAKAATPVSRCKLSEASEDNGYWKGATDVDLYYRSIVSLLASHKALRDNGVKVEHIIPNSGSGTYFYGCPHLHLEPGAVLINDIDGICKGDECEAAFKADYTGDESFYNWGQDRCAEGLQIEMEVFNAKQESLTKNNQFKKGGDYYWKSGMLELYDPQNGVKAQPLATTNKKFCVPQTNQKAKIVPIYNCPQCRVKEGKCTIFKENGDRIRMKGREVSPVNDWCEMYCTPGQPKISVPDCKSMCKFKRIMLNGTEEERKKRGGLAKLKQDLLDLRCLMRNCKLDKHCEDTEDKEKMELKTANDLKGVGFGPKDKNAAGPLADQDPPALEALSNELNTEIPAAMPCPKLVSVQKNAFVAAT